MKYGLIGEVLKHSFSKEIHSLIADYDYKLNEVKKDDLDAFMKAKDFLGINVTIPYKERIVNYIDKLDESAKLIGAVNTIVNRNGSLYGYNTDFYGLKSLILKQKVDLSDKTVAVLGTGGTSKTAKAVLKSLSAKKIVIVSRSKCDGAITYDDLYKMASEIDVVVNTTPVGMYPNVDASPIEVKKFASLKLIIDVVYNPIRTKLVSDAIKLGIKAEGGLYMLVAQAVKGSEIFLGEDKDALLDETFEKILNQKQNVVLTGMPASGKTTIGKILANALGREFVDTDDLIANKANKPITQIFESDGEQVFRSIETEVIKEVSLKTGLVIATGGGAILNEENVKALKQNGKIFFIDRPLESLIPTADRPTANTKEQITKRYNERYSLYVDTADEVVDGSGTADEVAYEILRRI